MSLVEKILHNNQGQGMDNMMSDLCSRDSSTKVLKYNCMLLDRNEVDGHLVLIQRVLMEMDVEILGWRWNKLIVDVFDDHSEHG